MKAIDVMNAPVVTVAADMPLVEVERVLAEEEVKAAVVEAEGAPVGVISQSDLFLAARREAFRREGPQRDLSGNLPLPALEAREVMTEGIISVAGDATVEAVCATMVEHGIHRVFVREGETLIGFVGAEEVLVLTAERRLETPIEDLMTRGVLGVEGNATIGEAAKALADADKQALVVFEDEWPVGTVSRDDLLLAREWPEDTAVDTWMNHRVLFLPRRMPAHRAAQHALALQAQPILVMGDEKLEGVVSSLDLARALMG